MFRIRTCRCSCFGLEKDITIDLQAPSAPPVCARCDSHGVASRLSDDDHVALYARALEDAKDETSLAHGDRDFYRNRSLEVSKAAGTLIRALTAVDSLHHERGGRRDCGDAVCAVQRLRAEPAVARLLATYDERQLTMMELRHADPGAMGPEWDYVDVTLVYPPRAGRPGARHRAAG